jgi:hypothetical protein
MRSSFRSSLPLLSSWVLALVGLVFIGATGAQARTRPRLGVLIVFDQLSAWSFERAERFFTDDGFGGIDGARYDLWFDYAGTETGPGHATLATGAWPVVHGIATNHWFAQGKEQYVVDDDAFPVLAPTAENDAALAPYGRSASRLWVPTLADAMKLDSQGRARIITLSHKDRAALLTGGKSADLAIWFDTKQGRYTTSTAYASKLPPWLLAQGESLPRQAMATGVWDPLPVPRGLEAFVPADDRPGEAAQPGFSRTFPHHLKDVDVAQQKNVYRLTPQAIDDLFVLALRAVDEEHLGQDDEPDLLVVSVSSTDAVGHSYGGDSLEALDLLRRADVSLRRFLRALHARLGRQGIVVAVTADHGGLPLPETMQADVPSITTVGYDVVEAAAERAIAAVLAAPKSNPGSKTPTAPTKKRVQGFHPPQLFLDVDDLGANDVERVYAAVKTAVESLPGIARVYDLDRSGDDDAFAPLMRASAPPGRSARLFVRQEPRVMFREANMNAGSDHGTPYSYDRRVPFLLRGPGVARGRFSDRVTARDVAASLAFALGVPPPDASGGTPVPALSPR